MSNTTTVPNHDLVVIKIGDGYLYDRTLAEKAAKVKGLTKDRAKAVRVPRWQGYELAAHYSVACGCGNTTCGYPVAEQVDVEPADIH